MNTAVAPAARAPAVRSPLLKVAPEPPKPRVTLPLIERLIAEQQTLTAVDRFARKHDDGHVSPDTRVYREMIPRAKPGPGQQYAFEVDLDVCTGCKACVAGCHSLNGLDDAEVWRTVGLIHGGTPQAPFQQTVTTACHHCVEPACMLGCPVQAYEKDAVTGIVKHLDDQCIGCQYCTFMCPYDAPKYSKERGIVRKCDMCTDRLEVGEAPACVQACPNEAIRIRVVDKAEAIQVSEARAFLPSAPAPDHTVPTTLYKSSKALPHNMLAADFYTTTAEHAHPPLVIMLTLTQLAAGAFATNLLTERLFGGGSHLAQVVLSLALGALAMGAAVFHLGRPLGAWRAFLGLRTSWMSREIITFSVFAKLGAVYALALVPQWLPRFPGRGVLLQLAPFIQVLAALAGLAGVFCSVMIYVVTRRDHWGMALTGSKFFLTTAVIGPATVALVSFARAHAAGGFDTAGVASTRCALTIVLVAGIVKLLFEASLLTHRRAPSHTTLKRMAMLLLGDLRSVTLIRFISGALGAVLLPFVLLQSNALGAGPVAPGAVVAAALILLLATVGEFAERWLFFAAAPPSRMPGGLH